MNKHIVLAGYFNLNVPDFEKNKEIQNLINHIFGYAMIPIISKPIRVTANTATANGHIKTKVIIDIELRLES